MGGKKVKVKHKFNFVRYGNDPDAYVEPVNASDVVEPEDNTPVPPGVDEVYIEGLETLHQLEATGFDDPRSIA